MKRIFFYLMIVLFAVLLISACGTGDIESGGVAEEESTDNDNAVEQEVEEEEQAEEATGEKEKVTLRLNWILSGEHTPFYVALDKGYYEEAGLDVEIDEGDGSATAVKLAANKSYDLSYADSATAAKGIAEGLPIQVVASYIQQNPMGVIFPEELGWKEPKDFIGKSIAVTQGDSLAQILPALLKLNDIGEDEVEIISVGTPAAKETAVLTGKADSFTAYYYDNTPRLEVEQDIDLDYVRYADFGITLLGSGLMAHNEVLKERPEMIKKFIAATNKGLEFAIENPVEASDILLEYSDVLIKEVVNKQTELAVTNVHTPNSEGKPLGWMDEDDWKQSLEILKEYGDLKGSTDPEEYYTNEFIPEN